MTSDVLVIGGGLAGSAAALQLARGGAHVTLIERERSPAHKVCGEFLSVEALHFLRQLGVDLQQLGAVPLRSVRLAVRGTHVERALAFPAMSLTRRCLDAQLLRLAEAAGANVQRGRAVEQLVRVDEAWYATYTDGQGIRADAVFLASGKHDVRGHPRPPGKQQNLVAFKMYWRLAECELHSLGSAVELFTYPGGYAGLQPVEGGLVNLCCLIQSSELRRLGSKWTELLAHMCRHSPHLQQRLCGAEPELPKPLTVASLPYGLVRQRSQGLWYVGDQAVVIPSFTGDGMSLALHTGMLATRMYLRGESADQYQQTLAAQLRQQLCVATAVSRVMVRFPRMTLLVPQVWPGAINCIARHTRLKPRYIDGE